LFSQLITLKSEINAQLYIKPIFYEQKSSSHLSNMNGKVI